MTDQEIYNMFAFHRPFGDQGKRYIKIREAARAFAEVIVDNTPASADQTAAVRKVREAMMTANSAIAVNEMPPGKDDPNRAKKLSGGRRD